MYYTGIGSRETPTSWCYVFTRLGKELSEQYGAVLRSGHADGADISFEDGCNQVYGKKEIYIPWKGFNHSCSDLIVENIEAYKLAEKYTPYWSNLKDSVKKLFARNTHQVLGWSLDSKSDFMVCWTKDGKEVGGTRLALVLARVNDIPIFNAGKYGEDYLKFYNEVLDFAKELAKYE